MRYLAKKKKKKEVIFTSEALICKSVLWENLFHSESIWQNKSVFLYS
jgi:hypothetical protein